MFRRVLIVCMLISIVGVLGETIRHPAAATASGTATVSCRGDAPGLSDCVITLQQRLDIDTSLIGTLTNPAGSIIGCNTLPSGGACTFTAASVTFSCTAGCAAGSRFRDVVQLGAGSGGAQSFAVSNTLAPTPPFPGATLIDTSSSGNISQCTSTDAFTGIGSSCLGIQGRDCAETVEIAEPAGGRSSEESLEATGVCSTASQSCVAQAGAFYVSACGQLPYATGVQPFLVGTPNTIGSSVTANPSCLQTYITASGSTNIQIC